MILDSFAYRTIVSHHRRVLDSSRQVYFRHRARPLLAQGELDVDVVTDTTQHTIRGTTRAGRNVETTGFLAAQSLHIIPASLTSIDIFVQPRRIRELKICPFSICHQSAARTRATYQMDFFLRSLVRQIGEQVVNKKSACVNNSISGATADGAGAHKTRLPASSAAILRAVKVELEVHYNSAINFFLCADSSAGPVAVSLGHCAGNRTRS
ncbi:hypothetical protein EVAR_66171_1 [Eumeta japonica]|uniref:Uncharacterized protein n=1 Tax=Eumeta variegata TaxID=151549 RepID=A0A4C1ZLN8_EUMVA|nr:hypothetical protein EVAR_66171_1 [Eumeta japonica]